MYRLLFTLLFALSLLSASAADFSGNLCDSTLRFDIILTGSTGAKPEPVISVKEMSMSPGWYGRRANLDSLALYGNGQLCLTDSAGRVLYRNSFSSLFSEWIQTDDPMKRSFEYTVLMPMPREKAKVELTLTDCRADTIASITVDVDPSDILIRRADGSPKHPFRYLHRGGDSKKAIDVAILAEGYTTAEIDSFYTAAQATVDEILSYEPYRRFRDRLNFVAVATVTDSSGVSIPREGRWLPTAFGSHFDTFRSDRYLTSDGVFAMHDALEGIPYEHIIILANTPTYGGAGIFNSYLVAAARNPHFLPVVVHEFGHSFAGLADEYFYETDVMNDTYPTDVEPWEQNITTLVDFDSKWADMIADGTPVPTKADKDKPTVGVFEGGGYSTKGVYRPADECRMRNNTYPTFCPVCERAISRIIEYYTTE